MINFIMVQIIIIIMYIYSINNTLHESECDMVNWNEQAN